MRFSLAGILIDYGAAKVFLGQFSALGAERLLQKFGDASPMGLLWAFKGASPAYQVFSGVIELLAGLLLAARRMEDYAFPLKRRGFHWITEEPFNR